MIHYAAKNLTRQLLRRNMIDSAKQEIYQYGLELTLSTLVTSSSIMLTACLMDSFAIGLLYFVVSIPLRMTAGGYHAPTYFRCFLISNAAYLAVSCCAGYLSSLALPYPVWLALLFGSAFYILKNCPVRNPHHPVSYRILNKNRRITILFLCILCSLMTLSYTILLQSYMLNFITVTISSVALFIVPCVRAGYGAESHSAPSCLE